MTGGSFKKNLHDYKNNQLAGLSTQSTKCDLRWQLKGLIPPLFLPVSTPFSCLREREKSCQYCSSLVTLICSSYLKKTCSYYLKLLVSLVKPTLKQVHQICETNFSFTNTADGFAKARHKTGFGSDKWITLLVFVRFNSVKIRVRGAMPIPE